MPDAPATAAPAPAPKSTGKLLIIALAAMALAAGGTYFYFQKVALGATAAESRDSQRAPAQYIALDPPFVVNFDAGASARFLQVAVQLMTRDLATADFIKAHEPAIRNDLVLLLGNQKVEEVSTREGKDRLRAQALESVRNILATEGGRPEKVEAVYFTSFVMQ